MNIIINALLLNGQFSGVQFSIENLLLALSQTTRKHKIEILLPPKYTGELLEKEFQFIRPGIYNTRLQRILWENLILPFHLLKRKKNVLYHSPGYVLPIWCPVSAIITVHDLIAIKYPQWCQNESAIYFKLFLPRALHRADKIIAVSETVKNEIIKAYSIDPQKIHVIYHGVKPNYKRIEDKDVLRRVTSKYNLPEKYILFVGNLEPKKNLCRLLEAFALVNKSENSKIKLVIVGKEGWKFNNIYSTVNKLKLSKDVIFTGYIPEEDLPAIYNMAILFAFPSLYEGFGLPVLEAMACGVPVITSDRGALPEITGNCGLLINPYDIEALVNAINRLLIDATLRNECIKKGFLQVMKFSWTKTAKEILDVYENIHIHVEK